jgi:hypothetical protein
MRKLYVNDKLVLVIYDNDLQVSSDEEENYNLDEYIYQTILINIQYDAVDYVADFRWEKGE